MMDAARHEFYAKSIMGYLKSECYGELNAKPRSFVISFLGLDPASVSDDRMVRDVYAHLPVGRGPGGLFIPADEGQVMRSIAFYSDHAKTEKLNRYAALMRTEYSRFFTPENRQMPLPLEQGGPH